jgi:hypothetical protein
MMLERLTQPVDTWVFLGIVLYLIWLIHNGASPKIKTSKKNNLKLKLGERVTRLPSQQPFDLSIYGSKLLESQQSLTQKGVSINNAAKAWESLQLNEREALIMSQFDFFQQFLNETLIHELVVERNNKTYGTIWDYDGPYSAICFDVYRGREVVGAIEVDTDLFEGQPAATIRAKLKFVEMFDYDTVESFFRSLARTHFDDTDPEVEAKLISSMGSEISKYLWNRMHATAEAKYDNDRWNWHEGEPLQMEFKGEFVMYNYFRSRASRDGAEFLKREHDFIKSNMEHLGYEEA